MDNAFLFDEGVGGVCSWVDYPYEGHKHWFKGCENKLCEKVNGTNISGFVNVTATDEGLMEALAVQPVSVAIDAQSVSSYMSYNLCYTCNDDLIFSHVQ